MTDFSVHPMFQGHKHQNFVRIHHKSSHIYPVFAFSVSLMVPGMPGILGRPHSFYYRDPFS